MQLQGKLFGWLGGRPAITRTVLQLKSMLRQYRRNPIVIETARRVMRAYNVPRENADAEVSALYRFLNRHIRYTHDPVDVELVQDPLVTLRMRTGDCDDIALLAASLAESIGIPTRFVLYSGNSRPLPHHIFTEARTQAGWTALDTVWNRGVGNVPPGKLELGGL